MRSHLIKGKQYKPPQDTTLSVNIHFIYGAIGEILAQNNDDQLQYCNVLVGGETIGRAHPNESRYYYLKDHLGSVRVTINDSGTAIGWDDYYPFGLQMPGRSWNQGNAHDDQKFTGHFLEQEGGLGIYHAHARMYCPETGRFWGVDAMRSAMPGWNTYHYTFNNPVRFVDLDGRMPGDYYDSSGNLLGTDGKKGGKVYVAKTGNSQSVSNAIQNNKFDTARSESHLLPSSSSRERMGEAVIRAGENSIHEEGGIGVQRGDSDYILDAKRGPDADIETGYAEINVFDLKHPEKVRFDDVLIFTFHTHPSGTINGFPFVQEPSATDIENVGREGIVGYVLAQGNQTVYIYNGDGIITTFPLDLFINVRSD